MKKNNFIPFLVVVLMLLLLATYSCTKRSQQSGSDKDQSGEFTEKSGETEGLSPGDSTEIYGSGYFDYEDTIESYHMGYSIPRDSVYKVENLEAFEELNLLLENRPVTPGPYLDRGNHLQNIHKYKEAILDYDEYINLVPGNHSGYMNRGTAHERLKHYDSALADYSKVIELKPRDTIAFFNRGVVYDALNNPWQAIREYDSVIIIDHKLAKAYYNRGKSYAKINDYEKAINDWEKAIELNPRYTEVLTRRINILKDILEEQ
ncbi:MAG: tetratricopeptide repeat protein [Ignavibacteria bacterium]|nr:tetratricopeptide repeat protein [Ignavibacteria bacterium]